MQYAYTIQVFAPRHTRGGYGKRNVSPLHLDGWKPARAAKTIRRPVQHASTRRGGVGNGGFRGCCSENLRGKEAEELGRGVDGFSEIQNDA